MNCKNHSEKMGTNTCSKCGDWLCDECAVEINGRIYCKSCLSKEVSDTGKFADTSHMTPHEHHVHHSMPDGKPPIPDERRPGGRVVSSFLTFCFSFIPGCGQMYLGLMKRGLMIMALFFAASYIGMAILEVFMFAIPIIWFYSFFDTFNNKRKIVAGEYVSDDINDIKNFCVNNKKMIGVSVIILCFIEMFNRFRYSHYYYGVSNILVIVLIVLGVYFIFSRKNKFIDKTDKKDKNDQ